MKNPINIIKTIFSLPESVKWKAIGVIVAAIGVIATTVFGTGERHPDVAASYNNLGTAEYSKGESDKAIVYFEKALEIRLEVLGERHPSVATSYNNLGAAEYSKGESDKAIVYHKKALEIRLDTIPHKYITKQPIHEGIKI